VIEGALDEYYRLAGWDVATGNPTPDTLARLGLEWAG
jgi:aldehyde:ferredoxin oxidoreductase